MSVQTGGETYVFLRKHCSSICVVFPRIKVFYILHDLETMRKYLVLCAWKSNVYCKFCHKRAKGTEFFSAFLYLEIILRNNYNKYQIVEPREFCGTKL